MTADELIFRGVRKRRGGPTRVVGGRVESVDGAFARVRLADGLEPVAVRVDGVTAVGAEIEVPVGTDGRPFGLAVPGTIPLDAELEHVGPTGQRILDQQLTIDGIVQELPGVRDALEAAQADADAAASAADAAANLARLAVVRGETAPAIEQGRLWFKTNAAGNVVGIYLPNSAGDAWVPYTLAAGSVVVPGSIGSTLIADGAVTSPKVNVTSELTARIAQILELAAEQVVIGRDARFTSGGLVFYAPPAQGQDPKDWANRTPIIALTPTGDVAISVAKNGKITAGMTPDGDVWGKSGKFDTLEVGGRTLASILAQYPLGSRGITRINNNVDITNVVNNVASLKVQLRKGRQYRLDYKLGMTRSSGEIRVRTDLVPAGGTAKTIADNATNIDGDFTTPVHFTLDEHSIADGATVEIKLYLRTATSGATGKLWGYGAASGGMPAMEVEDIGPTPPTYVVSAGQPAAPPVTQYGPEAIGSSSAVGIRTNGTVAPDGRLTVGGSVYGSDMAEWVVFAFDLSRLNGATVKSARVQITASANAPANVWIDAGTSYTANHQGLFDSPRNLGSNGSWAWDVPAAYLSRLVGKSYLIVKPYTTSGSDYVILASGAWLEVTYTK